MRAYERLLNYTAFDTQSEENIPETPSTAAQYSFAERLQQEMKDIGLERVFLDESAYVYGFLPATAGREKEPVIALIAHLDTAPDCSGTGVRPQLHRDYDGTPLALGESGLVLSPEQFPDLKDCIGGLLITTDGTTLLGADDKAGIAEILTACERLLQEKLPHGGIAVCFTPDEEIGHGAALLDLQRLGADYAYTLDGDAVNEINWETFHAASAVFRIRGVSVHPGSAKGIMVNASQLAAELAGMFPPAETPAETEGYEGFYHLTELCGSVEEAELRYIVRDHDAASFNRRCEFLRQLQELMNEKYGRGTVQLTLTEQYRNMAEKLRDRPEIVERAKRAVQAAGLEPDIRPVRGGTDGSQLSFRGLPCPNLGTGGAAFHGPYEHISAEIMDKAVDVLLHLCME